MVRYDRRMNRIRIYCKSLEKLKSEAGFYKVGCFSVKLLRELNGVLCDVRHLLVNSFKFIFFKFQYPSTG